MKRLAPLALLALLAVPAAAAAQPAAAIAVSCEAGAASGEAPNLHGTWDLVFDAGGTPNFGLLSIGLIDGAYGGSLSLWSTAPVVLREVRLDGSAIQMTVGTAGGDVRVDGRLSPDGNRMCGAVTYHDGRRFTMVARKRLTAYRPQAQVERPR
jgi:hypothetical protein